MRPFAFLLIATVLGPGACASRSTFEVERRQTPVHVIVEVPAFAAQGGQMQSLVYLGPNKVSESTLLFQPGQTRVELPTTFVNAGEHVLSAVFQGGTVAGRDSVEVETETWILIRVDGTEVGIATSDRQPR